VTDAAQDNAAPAAAPELTMEQEIAVRMGGVDDSPEPAGDGEAPPPPAQADPSPADSGEPTDEDPAAARRARLAELREREAQAAEARQREAALRKREEEFEQYKRRAEQAEARASQLLDLDGMTLDQFFEVCAQRGWGPQEIAERVRMAQEDPSSVARETAKKTVSSEVEALRAMVAEQAARIDQLQGHAQSAQYQAAEQAAAQELYQTVRAAKDAPLSAAFLEAKGEDRFYKLAISTAARLPDGAGMQAVLDAVEEELADYAPVYSSTQPSAPKPSATAPADTIHNHQASERSAVHEETDWADLSAEERAAWFKQRYA